MMQSARYKSMLRTIFAAILQSNLSAADLKALSQELRRGRLTDDLSLLLDQFGNNFLETRIEIEVRGYVEAAERLIKSKKISKSVLLTVISSIDDGFFVASQSNYSVRAILENFFDASSAQKAKKLLDVLSSLDVPDQYLKGIAENRD
jgi:hypothetical protein